MPADLLQPLMQVMSTLISNDGPLIVFLSVFLLGENGIVAAFALSAQGLLLPGVVFLFACLGSLTADIFWYTVAVKGVKRFPSTLFMDTKRGDERALLVRLADRHTFLFLVGIKFLVGMRVFFTFYILLKKHVPFREYLLCNVIGTLLFVGILFPVGWLLGNGMSAALSVEKGFFGLISFILIGVVLVNIVPRVAALFIATYAKEESQK